MILFVKSAIAKGATEEKFWRFMRRTFGHNRPKNDAVLEIPRVPKARGKKIFAIFAKNFCQTDPKMMRFTNSASADGASEENLAIYATNFCQVDPKMIRISNSASAEGSQAKKIWQFDATNFCQVEPKRMRFLFRRAPKARAKKIWILMRRISAK